MRKNTCFLIILIALAACQTAAPPQPVSTSTRATLAPPERMVTDAAGILTPEEIYFLEASLVAIEKRELATMAIYIAPSLPPGENLEDYTLRAANDWGLGRAGIDDGLLIFVFVSDRKIRIELGLGLEHAISNEAAARIIAENMAPSFRRKAYAEGLRSAVQELERLLLLHPPRAAIAAPSF